MTFGVLGEPPTLDPYSTRATDLTRALVRPLYPSLFAAGENREFEPSLAASLEDIHRGVRIRLRRARWSNGRPITSEDVLASVRRARRASGFAVVHGGRTVGRRGLVLFGPKGNWPKRLSTAAYVLPRGRPGTVSGGPWKIASYRRGLQVVYEPNPRWWGQRPYLDELKVQFVSGLRMMLSLARAEKLDAFAPPSSVNMGDRIEAMGLLHAESAGSESLYVDYARSGLDSQQRAGIISRLDFSPIRGGLIRADGKAVALGRTGPVARPDGPVLMLAPAGDELLVLISRIAQGQLRAQGLDVQLGVAEPAMLYGDPAVLPPAVTLGRTAAPLPVPHRAGATRVPIFRVETIAAWAPQVHGIAASPGLDGPLWNAQGWWIAR